MVSQNAASLTIRFNTGNDQFEEISFEKNDKASKSYTHEEIRGIAEQRGVSTEDPLLILDAFLDHLCDEGLEVVSFSPTSRGGICIYKISLDKD